MSDIIHSKRKSSRQRQFPVDFVVPMQLEECIHKIESAQNTETTWKKPLTIRLLERQVDTTVFRGNLYDDARIEIAAVRGTLRRWEGTSTRIVGHITMYDNERNLKRRQEDLNPFSTVIMIGVIIAATFAHMNDLYSIMCLSLTLLIPFVILINYLGLALLERRDYVSLRRRYISLYLKLLRSTQ
jgi:hypothetical protein